MSEVPETLSTGYFELSNPLARLIIRVQEPFQEDQMLETGCNHLKFRQKLVSFSENYIANTRRFTKWNLWNVLIFSPCIASQSIMLLLDLMFLDVVRGTVGPFIAPHDLNPQHLYQNKQWDGICINQTIKSTNQADILPSYSNVNQWIHWYVNKGTYVMRPVMPVPGSLLVCFVVQYEHMVAFSLVYTSGLYTIKLL